MEETIIILIVIALSFGVSKLIKAVCNPDSVKVIDKPRANVQVNATPKNSAHPPTNTLIKSFSDLQFTNPTINALIVNKNAPSTISQSPIGLALDKNGKYSFIMLFKLVIPVNPGMIFSHEIKPIINKRNDNEKIHNVIFLCLVNSGIDALSKVNCVLNSCSLK